MSNINYSFDYQLNEVWAYIIIIIYPKLIEP